MTNELHRVVSLDENRVVITNNEGNKPTVTKKTTQKEFENLFLMRTHLSSGIYTHIEWREQTFTVVTPKIVDWDSVKGELKTEYFDGDNLELKLLDTQNKSRAEYVELTSVFVKWMKGSGIVWKDAAPRNILVNEPRREICILDFEKGIELRQNPYSDEELKVGLRGIIFEEMCAFLFPNEQNSVFGNIWSHEDILIPYTALRGKREPILYRSFFGEFGSLISSQKLEYVQKIMAAVVTPYYIDDKPFFPLTLLAQAGSPEKYTALLLELLKMDQGEWPSYLASAIKK